MNFKSNIDFKKERKFINKLKGKTQRVKFLTRLSDSLDHEPLEDILDSEPEETNECCCEDCECNNPPKSGPGRVVRDTLELIQFASALYTTGGSRADGWKNSYKDSAREHPNPLSDGLEVPDPNFAALRGLIRDSSSKVDYFSIGMPLEPEEELGLQTYLEKLISSQIHTLNEISKYIRRDCQQVEDVDCFLNLKR